MEKTITKKQIKKVVEENYMVYRTEVLIDELNELGIDMDNFYDKEGFVELAKDNIDYEDYDKAIEMLDLLNNSYEDTLYYHNEKTSEYRGLDDIDEIVNTICELEDIEDFSLEDVQEIASQTGGRIINFLDAMEDLTDDCSFKECFMQVGQYKEMLKGIIDSGLYNSATNYIDLLAKVDNKPTLLDNNDWLYVNVSEQKIDVVDNVDVLVEIAKDYYELEEEEE